MAYITTEYGGKKTFGGYLSIDGDKQIVLTEGVLIKVPSGSHNLNYMNVPKANKKIMDANIYAGNVGTVHMMAESMIEWDYPVELEENDLLTLKVISDDNGKILSVPDYEIVELSEEAIAEANRLYSEQASEGIQADGSNVKTEFFICLFLGWLGIHKFYRGKTFMGIIYFLTLGFFFAGWIIDTLILLIKVLSLKKK